MRKLRVDEGEDIIDSRDVIEKIRELENDRDYIKDKLDEAAETEPVDVEKKVELEKQLREFDEDEDQGGELSKLKKLESELENEGDWTHGITLINDSYFKQYAMDLAEDVEGMDDRHWPFTCIDWDQAVKELQHDYSSVEFGSTTYWYRS